MQRQYCWGALMILLQHAHLLWSGDARAFAAVRVTRSGQDSPGRTDATTEVKKQFLCEKVCG